ncbi:MAG TPA: archaetidylserine decarboxylase [Gammaproteobacteria bacterium]|nr:archaetidylserine decarboxylase [Gammaproteobacteria bacterium]
MSGIPAVSTLRVAHQFLLPQHTLSRLVYRITRSRNRFVKDRLIRWFVRHYRVDLGEARDRDPAAYLDFNSFFTRALRPGVRPLAADPETLVSPADGRVSEFGTLDGERLLQAKGRAYSAVDLLGGSEQRAAPFRGGAFLTIYLAPCDYHRVHMPQLGTLRESVYLPGRLFSVSDASSRSIPRLFARNERVASLFDTPAGPMAIVLVGAMLVGFIDTVWGGPASYPYGRQPRVRRYPDTNAQAPTLARGAQMGHFGMGSTVILLFPRGRVEWAPALETGAPVRVGEPVGRRVGGAQGSAA